MELIIGNDFYGSLITGKIVQQNGVMAMESRFGWLLSGPMNESGSNISMNHVSCSALMISNDTLNQSLQKFWEISSCGNEGITS